MNNSIHDQKKPKNILVVDDDPKAQVVYGLIISPFANVTIASSGNEAIEILKQNEFDLVFTDYQMPNGDGLDLIDFIKKNEINIPVILATAFGTKEVLVKAINHQIFAFIDKPIINSILEEKILQGLEIKHSQDLIKSLARIGEATSELIHEIANPLTLIDLKFEEIKDEATSSNNQTMIKNIDKLIKNSGRIGSLISATKCIIRSDCNKDRVEMESIPFDSLFSDVFEYCIFKAKNNGVKLTIQKNPEVVLFGDRSKLCQLFINLINNGIDAISILDEKWINVSTEFLDDSVSIIITDSGKGISKEIKENMFKPLYSTKGKKGLGLGLKIASDIVQLHSGSIAVTEGSENTQFKITLPKKCA